jgi:hypothetical protein
MSYQPTAWQRFTNEEQDPQVVQEAVNRLSQLLTSQEEIVYIAVQKKPGVTISPAVVSITTRRVIVYKARMLGQVGMDDHIWRDIADVRVAESMMGATLTFRLVNGHNIVVDSLPKAQARRIYQIAQEREEAAHEERRQRELEDKRAAAGGIYMQNVIPAMPVAPPPAAPTMSLTPPAPALPSPEMPALPAPAVPEDPVARLKQLKAMLDADLISQAEYDTKKAEILSRM